MDYLGNDRYPNANTPGLIISDVSYINNNLPVIQISLIPKIMRKCMVEPLPRRCRLTALFDVNQCDHFPNPLDFPYVYDLNGVVKSFRHPDGSIFLPHRVSNANIVSLGTRQDDQSGLVTDQGGAMRCAFIHCMKSNNTLTYKALIRDLCIYMRTHDSRKDPSCQALMR
ncbi:hypothetical protein BJV77DRAFT_765332 [Russula vinacea]|nr:hypothetical protein BJV77DRAFT_765332 [Russula vinacea]